MLANIIFFITGLLCGAFGLFYIFSLWYVEDDPMYYRWKNDMDEIKNENR